jgi:hypothetical protein
MKTLWNKTTLLFAVAAMMGLTAQSAAWADGAVSERFPVETTVTTCDGNVIVISGEFHVVTSSTIDENGGVHVVSHVNTVGVTGTDPVTGASYRGNAVNNTTYNFNAGAASERTESQTFVLVGQGRASNQLLRYQFKYTANANGEVTVSFINVTAECQ